MEHRRWRLRQARLAFENSRIRVLEDDVLQPDGSVCPYTVIEERLGAVAVIAVDDDNRIALVRQHRYPIDATTLEVPAGEVALGGDPIEQARRELAEETGILAGRLRVIGRFAPWPARVRRYCDVVLADQLSCLSSGRWHRTEPKQSRRSISMHRTTSAKRSAQGLSSMGRPSRRWPSTGHCPVPSSRPTRHRHGGERRPPLRSRERVGLRRPG